MKLKEIVECLGLKSFLEENKSASICQDITGRIYAFSKGVPTYSKVSKGIWTGGDFEFLHNYPVLSEDYDTAIITYGTFQNTYWDGVVDLEVGHILEVWHDDKWKEVTVDYIKGDFVVVLDGLQNAEKFSWSNNDWKKSMTPEEKTAEEERRKAVFKMLHLYTGYSIYRDSTSYNTQDIEDMSRVYDAIKRVEIKIG